jgi:hypothetical protein
MVRTAPQVYATRAEAERALWAMASDDQADCSEDSRYRALVLLATFASPRWGEVTALGRCDLDLTAGCVRATFSERRAPESAITLGPPKSKAARGVVGVPRAIIPDLREHLVVSAGSEPGRWSSPLRRALHYGDATSTGRSDGRTSSLPSGRLVCISMIYGTPGTRSRRLAVQASKTSWRGWIMTVNGPPWYTSTRRAVPMPRSRMR